MKHTKHALTYLRRQYSAVLKHAYALGIATVIVLSLGSANANTATASTRVTDQQSADDLLNNWKSEYQIQIDSERVVFQSRFNITIASEDNFIKNTRGTVVLSTLHGPISSIELNGENASFEIGNSSSLVLDQFTLTKGTLTINGTLNADLNMNGGTFSGSLTKLSLNSYGTKRKITFTQGGNFITSGFTPLSNKENSLDITVDPKSAQGSSLISIQPGATVTLPEGNIRLGSDLTVTGGTLNIGNNVNLTATSDAGALNIGSTDSAGTLQVDSAKLSNFIAPSTGSSGHINLVNGSSLQVSGDTAVDLGKGVTFDSSDITVSGSNFTASEAIEGSNASISAQSLDLSYSGTASEIKTLTGTNGLNITGTAALKVDTLNLATSSNGDILVGNAASQTATNSVTRAANNASNATPRITSNTADLAIAKLDLAGRSLAASADSSAPAAVVAIGELVSSNGSSTSSAGTSAVTNRAIRSAAMRAPANTPVVLANPTPMSINNGNIVALQNAIVGVGVSDTATLRRTFNTGNVKYLDSNGQLNNSDGVKSILYVDQHVSLNSRYRLIADGSTNDLATALSNAGSNNIYIGENSAVAVPVSIATNDQAAIHIDTIDATAKGGTNSKIVIVDGMTTQDLTDLNLLSDKGGSDNNTGVTIADDSQDIEVKTLSGRFRTVLKAGQSYSTVTLEKVGGSGGNQGGGSQGGGTGSNPGSGGDGSTVLPPETSKPTHDATEDYIDDSVPNGEYNPVLDYTVLFDGSESTAETVARLGPYGGIAHSALAASNATYSSIATRMGLGAMRLDTDHMASNANGAVLWLNPLYRSSSSDDFANEGQGYGVDVDLYGVALGADVALNPSWRIGALFNVGSGSVDGSGAGAAVDNDFDYYSLGTYSAFTTGAFTLVGDVSYTAVSNDVSATTPASSIGKVGADIDCSSFSFGLTSKFDFALGDLTLSPHVGMRYSHLAIDDYNVTGHETYASFSAQSMDIFSLPVGMMLATDIAAGDWQVQPALDLTITPYFGDTELKGDVSWTGVSIRSYQTVTEVLDDVTYGATLGIAASNGALSFGLSLSYTGSSNTDELGLQANARLSF